MKLVIHTLRSNNAAQLQRQPMRAAAQRYLLLAAGVVILVGAAALFSVLILTIAAIVLVLAGVAWSAAMIRGLYWQCPRCQRSNYFAARRGYQCQHCDVPQFSPEEPANQQWETIDVPSSPVSQ